MKRIILVEDDRLLNTTLQFNLKLGGYEVQSYFSCRQAEEGIAAGSAELLLLDVNLGDGSGFELWKKHREEWSIPCVFLTVNDMESDMIKGYELGAEDYITKPFSMAVLLKKCAVLLKRFEKEDGASYYDDGWLFVDFDTTKAVCGGKEIVLTPLEFRMVRLFSSNQGRVLTRQTMLERLWDNGGNYVDEHTLTTNVNRLRRKLEDENHTYIKTVYGMGYLWKGGEGMDA